jgi:UDP:flavonoid glycosyltransferase YjiC (YdhE family)
VRTGEAPFDVAEQVPGDGKIVYLSLGSLGCMDVGLMQRLIDTLAKTDYRVIVSMGPLKDQITLGPNMYGDQFLPQPSILPQCDLLITHGGNNTMCEGFHFGLPMIGLPLFWDQYDNAQRLRETGFGERLPTYDWTDEELIGAVDRLMGDGALRARMRANAESIRSRPGHILGADILERIANDG